MTVRPARAEDAAQMARVNVRCWQETYRGIVPDAVLDDPGFPAARERFWTAALTDERYRENRVAVAERDGALIGIAMSGPPLDAGVAWTRQLYVLYVHAADHGTGAGPALLEAVIDPAEPAALWVADPNPRAHAFYRKHGFVADGTVQVEDGVREIRMVRGDGGLRDYEAWHRAYDDPSSGLSWRLRAVQTAIERALDEHPGDVRVLSLCAGDGRDILEVFARRDDAGRVAATLVEVHPQIAARARELAARTDASVDVRVADAGRTDAFADVVPADIVLLVGIFGNVSRADLDATIAASPGLCRPGATLVWSRARKREDLDAHVRGRFAAAGFTELDHLTLESGGRPAVGVERYDGPSRPLAPGRQLFTFRR